ncbi:MAG: hypothetical protein AB8I08_03515 [Sandaracinaceae bacterium]
MLLVGCGAPARRGAIEASPPAAPVTLRQRIQAHATFTRRQSLALMDDGSGAGLRISTRSNVEMRTFDEHQVMEHSRYLDLTLMRDGEDAGQHARLRGIGQLTVRRVTDARGITVEPPRATGQPSTSPDLHAAVLAVLRLLRVEFPERPVVPGDRWEGAPVEWDSPPSHRVTVVLEPAWRLRGFDVVEGARVARVDWDAHFRILPFAAMAGTTLEGEGTLEGTSRVFVEDGRLERTELEVRVSVGPSGAAALSLFQFEAKYEEVLVPAEASRRSLIGSVRPHGTRAREDGPSR